MLNHEFLTSQIISAAFFVHSALGSGHLEHVYQNALARVLTRRGFRVHVESRIPVHLPEDPDSVGFCRADLIVEDTVVVETKATDSITSGFRKRARAYLRCSGRDTARILNFGADKLEIRRLDDTKLEEHAG